MVKGDLVKFTPEQLAGFESPFDDLVGVRFLEASEERVLSEVEITPKHHQPHGIVHGGVYATIIEVSASVGGGAWMADQDQGGTAMGVSNHTDFIRAVTEGRLECEAVPLQQGRSFQVWEAKVTDEQDRLVAHGKVRLFNRWLRPEAG